MREAGKTLQGSGSQMAKDAAKRLNTAVDEYEAFIDQAIKLRHTLVAHTSHDAPLHASFVFEGLTLECGQSQSPMVLRSSSTTKRRVPPRDTLDDEDPRRRRPAGVSEVTEPRSARGRFLSLWVEFSQ